MPLNDQKNNANEKSLPIGVGFIGHFADSGTSVADVSNGKMVRIRPLHYDWKYDPKEL